MSGIKLLIWWKLISDVDISWRTALNFGSHPLTLRCDLDFWPLTSNICSVSPVTWWNSVPNLNAIEQSQPFPRRSYCDYSVWPNDLEHVIDVAPGTGIIFTKFDLRQLIRAWIIAFFMLICYVIMWPWPLTRWSRKFVVNQASRDQSLYEIWAKSSNPRLNYWKFCNFFADVMSRYDLDI